jgi:hypothetical protein
MLTDGTDFGSPAGLSMTTDEALQGILSDLEGWREALPEELQFRGPKTPRNAGMSVFTRRAALPTASVPPRSLIDSMTNGNTSGLLHLLYSCVNMLFWRVFMRISYTCPEHLKFALTVEKWTELVQLTGSSIDWLHENERVYDVWLLVAYCATSCALVQVRLNADHVPGAALDANGRIIAPVPHLRASSGPRSPEQAEEAPGLHPAVGGGDLV